MAFDSKKPTSVHRLYVLLCGFEIMPKAISTRDLGEHIIMSEPVSVYLIETADGWILVDTGIDEKREDNPVPLKSYFSRHSIKPLSVQLPQHYLSHQLSLIGIEPGMIKSIILTHTHPDHIGNLKHFSDVKIYIQRREYEHILKLKEKLGDEWFQHEYGNRRASDWQLIDGDMDILPGLNLISTPGHTPGHQSVRAQLPSGAVIIMAGDVGDLSENFEKEILPSETVDDVAALQSIQRLKRLASAPNTHLFLCHDPILIQTLKLAPHHYD